MNSSRRVLLLNPPGKVVYIRDYFCSKTSRSDYTFAPIALLHAGAVFRGRGWGVQALDAVVLGLDMEETLDRCRAIAPDAAFILVGAASVGEDEAFLAALRAALPGAVLIGCGDVLLEGGARWIERGLIDAAALDFTANSPARFAEGERGNLTDLVYRDGGRIQEGPRGEERTVSVGLPPHELFLDFPYRFPFARKRPVAGLLTDFACPFRCRFCVMAGLPYHRRPMDEVAREVEYVRSLGFPEFILWDQTFAAGRERALEFLDVLPGGRRRLGWTCFTRPDCIDADLARRMAERGCHTAIMGVESANPETLRRMHKDFTPEHIRQGFAACRAAGIGTVATAIVGLPGETEADVEATIHLVCEVSPDYLSVHTAVPRSGTELRSIMVEQGLVPAGLEDMDQSGAEAAVASDSLDAATILALRRRFNRRFYLRPGYLLQTTCRLLRSPGLLLEQLRQGLVLLQRNRP